MAGLTVVSRFLYRHPLAAAAEEVDRGPPALVKGRGAAGVGDR